MIRKSFVLDIVHEQSHALALHMPEEGHEAVEEAGRGRVEHEEHGEYRCFDERDGATLPFHTES